MGFDEYNPDGGAFPQARPDASAEDNEVLGRYEMLQRRQMWLEREAGLQGVELVPGPIGGLWPKLNGDQMWTAELSLCVRIRRHIDPSKWPHAYEAVPPQQQWDEAVLGKVLLKAAEACKAFSAQSELHAQTLRRFGTVV